MNDNENPQIRIYSVHFTTHYNVNPHKQNIIDLVTIDKNENPQNQNIFCPRYNPS